jgi:hypothetical protein
MPEKQKTPVSSSHQIRERGFTGDCNANIKKNSRFTDNFL